MNDLLNEPAEGSKWKHRNGMTVIVAGVGCKKYRLHETQQVKVWSLKERRMIEKPKKIPDPTQGKVVRFREIRNTRGTGSFPLEKWHEAFIAI